MTLTEKISDTGAEPAKNKSNTQQALETLRQMILSNELAPGSNHLEKELASLLGMSRTPVREATLILEAQGLVEVKPRHGVRILSLSSKDMAEIYEILTELESLSAELAANRGHDAKEFKIAEKAITDMENALAKDNREAWAEADEIFHSELVRLGGNKRIAEIIGKYNDQVRRVRYLTLNLRPAPTKSNDDHRNVLEAIRNGKAATARKLHTAHRIQAKTMLLSLLDKYGFQNL